MQLVLAEFLDAVTHDNWAEVEEVEQSTLKTAFACGFLVSDNKDKVTIALLSTHGGGAHASWVNISKADVVGMEILKDFNWEDVDHVHEG